MRAASSDWAGLPFESVAVCGSEAVVIAGQHTVGLVGHRPGGVCAVTLKVEFRGLGVGVTTRCASGSGRAMRSAVIRRNMCGTAGL